ncbi:MAG TPA: NPCBM/NEW2 domain-containing protein [Verrucomicrobiae bacterium]|nr:NPCBM/NEW2 domain-containing protein [Verrucomicrobiae bacterium]
MKTRLAFSAIISALECLLICSCATDQPSQPLAVEVPINRDAGRGGLLIAMVRLQNGEELPFVVDTGASGSLIDKSLAPKLGNPIGSAVTHSWGVTKTNLAYAAPTLLLGGVPLKMTGPAIVAYDCQNEFSYARPRIMGLLGMDVLENYCIQLDFPAGKMRFLQEGQRHGDNKEWGRAFPIVPLNANDTRPAVAENLLGLHGPHSLIDVGCNSDGWLMPNYFQSWTNHALPPSPREARAQHGYFAGEKYPLVSLQQNDVEADGIGLRFLARHLVTLDFPNRTLYLARKNVGPLTSPDLKTTALPALDALIANLLLEETHAIQRELARIEHSRTTERVKAIARKLTAAWAKAPKPVPANVPPARTLLFLGDAQPESAEVGWLEPAANCIPPNAEIASPLLDSGKIYATGLYAHSPSRYVFNLGGGWNRLRGKAGLHTAYQGRAFGVIFIIKADGREVFRSTPVRGSNPIHYDVDIEGVKALELVVEKAGNQNGGNWALWLEPELLREPSM